MGTCRRSLSLFLVFLLSVAPFASAATRPVSIGACANWEQYLSRSANLGWARIDILWSAVNPSPGVWNLQPVEDQISAAIAQGQQILGILHRPPEWIGGGPKENIPPRSTVEWSEFVRRIAQQFAGRIAAYEIWNEPDQKNTEKVGIGWGRNIEEPPLYVDFLHAAAVEIRTWAPGTLVVGPTFQSRNDSDGTDNRKKRILQQIQGALYPDGPGYSFLDVVSVHNNAGGTEAAWLQGYRLNYENLAYVWNHAPSLRTRPIWVTEFGWKANQVGESGQRERICEVAKTYTAHIHSGTTNLGDWDVRRAFIFLLKDPATSAAIFRYDNSPTPTVTQYLQRLAYPAVQNPAGFYDYPACTGASFAAAQLSPEETAAALADLGLGDPRPGLPAGYSVDRAERSDDGRSLDILLRDRQGGSVTISISPASPDNDRRALTDAGAEWTSGSVHLSVAGVRAGAPVGKGFLRALAAALDPAFGRSCMTESVTADDNAVRRFGFAPPAAPSGFAKTGSLIEFTRPTGSCGAEKHSPILDFVWTFGNRAGDVIRAGIYRYGGGGSQESLEGERSLHWGDANGTRYWVAAGRGGLREALVEVARSMDPSFGG